jgi:hypothetical protein
VEEKEKGKVNMNDTKCPLSCHNTISKSITDTKSDEHGRIKVSGGFVYKCPECTV